MDTIKLEAGTNPFAGTGTLTNMEAVLFANTELMTTVLPQVTEEDMRFAEENIKNETERGPDDTSKFTTLEELSRRYQMFAPPENDDSL